MSAIASSLAAVVSPSSGTYPTQGIGREAIGLRGCLVSTVNCQSEWNSKNEFNIKDKFKKGTIILLQPPHVPALLSSLSPTVALSCTGTAEHKKYSGLNGEVARLNVYEKPSYETLPCIWYLPQTQERYLISRSSKQKPRKLRPFKTVASCQGAHQLLSVQCLYLKQCSLLKIGYCKRRLVQGVFNVSKELPNCVHS